MKSLIKKKKILITGSNGLLGSKLSPYLKNFVEVYSSSCNTKSDFQFDLTKFKDVKKLIEISDPDFILNLAALTNVDECEKDPRKAYMLNVQIVDNLANSLKNKKNKILIQISTDQVYDSNYPSKETDINISNVYSLTKFLGEKVAKNCPAIILRTNFFGKSKITNRLSLSDWIIYNLKNNISFTGFSDVIFNPVSIYTLCKIIRRIIENQIIGTFNVGSRDHISKLNFACQICHLLKKDIELIRDGTVDSVDLFSYRPKNMSMNISKFEKSYDYNLPLVKDEIKNINF